MIVKERTQDSTLTEFSACFQLMLTYRVPMKVEEVVVFHCGSKNDMYYRCPRCQSLMEREFMAYCSCCGQCIEWLGYRKAKRKHFYPYAIEPKVPRISEIETDVGR